MRETRETIFRLLGIELVLLSVGRGLGELTSLGKQDWYGTVTRSVLTPPDWVFGVVWTLLYLIIGIVFWRLWEKRQSLPNVRLIFGLFGAQMLMNWAWTPLFFICHALLLSFVWLLGLVALLIGLIVLLWSVDRLAAAMMAPYLAWCLFASYLSGFIAFAN